VGSREALEDGIVPEEGEDLEDRRGHRRRWALVALLALLGVGAWIGVLLTALTRDVDAGPPAVETGAVAGAVKRGPPAALAEGPYRIAHLDGDVPAYEGPGGAQVGTVAGEWWGYASALPVLDERDGFLLDRLQQRPNESTAWIAAEGVGITETQYRIEVN
jgi:hypothetical protein